MVWTGYGYANVGFVTGLSVRVRESSAIFQPVKFHERLCIHLFYFLQRACLYCLACIAGVVVEIKKGLCVLVKC
jgi:hypothetical protein